MSSFGAHTPDRPRNILVALPDDELMGRLQGAFRSMQTPIALYQVRNEGEIMAFLRKGGGGDVVPRPDMILLDESLLPTLGRIKSDSPYSSIPVIVMGDAISHETARAYHRLHANACVGKPQDAPAMRSLAAAIEAFWFLTAELPPNKAA